MYRREYPRQGIQNIAVDLIFVCHLEISVPMINTFFFILCVLFVLIKGIFKEPDVLFLHKFADLSKNFT